MTVLLIAGKAFTASNLKTMSQLKL